MRTHSLLIPDLEISEHFRYLAEAPGIEADSGQLENTTEHQSGTISTDADPASVSDRARKCAIVRGVVTEWSEGV